MIKLDAFFESYYRLRPVNATFTGVHDYDHRLPDWSPDGLASALDEMRALRTSLDAGAVPQKASSPVSRSGKCPWNMLAIHLPSGFISSPQA